MRRHRPCGFTLIDAMMTVALVALAFPLAISLIRVTMRADRGFAEAQAATTRFDGAMNALRKDVWNGSVISAVGDHELSVEQGGGAEPVQWRAKANGALERDVTGEPPRIWALDHSMVFKIDGPTLSVSLPSDRDGRGIAMTFTSQRLLARKGLP